LAFVQTPGGFGKGGIWGLIGDAVAISKTSFLGTVVTHAVVGGAISMAQGGSFVSGAISGAVGSFAGEISGGLGKVGQLVVTAVAGGTASVLAGGKFANGAITSAFALMFNNWMHGDGEEGAAGVRGGIGAQSGRDQQAWQNESSGRAGNPDISFLREAADDAAIGAAVVYGGEALGVWEAGATAVAWARGGLGALGLKFRNAFYKQADELTEWFTRHTPSQSKPYDVLRRENSAGRPEWTTYDKYGRKAYEYAPNGDGRHGPHYHEWGGHGRGYPNGQRSDPIPLE